MFTAEEPKQKWVRTVETETDQRPCNCLCIIRGKCARNTTQCKNMILHRSVQRTDVSCKLPIEHDSEELYLIWWLDGDSSDVNVNNNCSRLSRTKHLRNYSIRLRMLSASMFTHNQTWSIAKHHSSLLQNCDRAINNCVSSTTAAAGFQNTSNDENFLVACYNCL